MEQAVIMKQADIDRLIEGVKKQVSEEFQTLKGAVIEKPISRKEAACYLGVSLKTLDNWISAGVLPTSVVHRTGKLLHFFPSELQLFIKKS